jgi:hypothetical protein
MSFYKLYVGKRIRCDYCSDTYSPIESGTEGIVRYVDDMNTLHIEWENGRTLGLVPGEDKFTILT